MKVESESEVTQSCLTLLTPWAAAHQAPPSMGFSRQEYWSGLLFPSPGEDYSQPLNACLVRSLPVSLWHEYTLLLFAH